MTSLQQMEGRSPGALPTPGQVDLPYLGRVRCAPKCADQCRGGVSTEGLPAEAIQGSNRAVEESLRGGVSSLVCLAKGGRVLADVDLADSGGLPAHGA